MTKGTIRRALFAAKNLRKGYDDGGLITPRSLAQRIMPPEEFGAVSPSQEGVAEAVTGAVKGIVPAAKTAYDYMATTPYPKAIQDVGGVLGGMAESAKEKPMEFIGGMLPGIGNLYAAKDVSELKDKISEARAAGNEQTAAQMEKMLPVAAASMFAPFGAGAMAKGALRGAESTIARELTPLGLYSHGAETAMGLPQAKGTPEQIAAMLQKQGVKPEEMFSSGFADESATNALRAKIEADFTPRIEAAQQALEGLVPGTEEFKKAERLVKNLTSTMRGDMDRALVLSKSIAERPALAREEAAQFFKEKMPVIEETVLGKTTKGQPYPEEAIRIEQEIMDRYRDDLSRFHAMNMDFSLPKDVRDEAYKKYVNLMNKRDFEIDDAIPNREALIEAARDKTTPTKFGSYTLPGGKNYREVLLKLPHEEKRRVGVLSNGTILTEEELANPIVRRTAEKIGLTMEDRMMPTMVPFRSQHWDDPNVLAHIRMSDRIGPNGEKILHIEEIQSDWAQKGRKEGFAQELDPKILDQLGEEQTSAMFKLEDARKAFNDAYENIFKDNLKIAFKDAPTEYDLPNALKRHDEVIRSTHPQKKFDEYKSNFLRMPDTFTLEQNSLLQDAYDAHLQAKYAYSAAKDKLAEYKSLSKGITSAPYVTNTQGWTDLALKRVLKEAAEGGYDKVVWTPGAEQANRYNLSRQVKQIIAENREDGIALNVYDHNDNKIITPRGLTMDQVAEYVGKEVAEKIQAQFEASQKSGANTPRADLRGLDLKLGGEGMIGYYDKIVPTQLSKLTKKLDPDAKIGMEAIPSSGSRNMVPPYSPVDLVDWLPETRGLSDPEKNAWLKSKTEEEKKVFWQQYLDAHHPKQNDILGHSLVVTPQMRENILKGMPHMADGGAVDKYPLRDHTDWEEAHDYEKSGGKLHYESPDRYLDEVKPLNMDHEDKHIIHHFKKQMEHGEKLDPVAILPGGHPNGRHRAHAAKKLGIKKIPVIKWPDKNRGGSIVDRALMLTSRKAKAPGDAR